MNYSTTITVNMLTPGFMSSVYVLANTMNNMTMNYQALQFPSIYRNNLSKESYFS